MRLSAVFLALLLSTFNIGQSGAADKAAVAHPVKIVVGSELNYPPYAMVTKTGLADGFSVDLMKAVCEVMGINVTFRVGPWSEVRDALGRGEINALPLVSYSKERDKVFDFTIPHTVAHGVAFKRKKDPGINSANDLRGKSIIVMKSDAAHDWLLRNDISENLILTKTVAESLLLLAEGKHDFALTPRLVGLVTARGLGLSNIEVTGPLFDAYGRGYGFAVKQGDHALLSQFNEGLSIVRTTGRYDEIYDKWFGVVDPKGIPTATVIGYVTLGFGIFVVLGGLVSLWIFILRRKVGQRTAELKAAHDGLELRVEERTQELTNEIAERQRAEEALRETSAILQTALDCSPAGIAIADAPDGKLRYVNKAGLGIRGGTNEEFVNGVGIDKYVESWQILHFDGSPFALDEVPLARAILFGETCDKQFIVRRPDQEDRIVWAHAAPVLGDHGEVVAGIVIFPDITDAYRAEEALRESDEKHSAMIANIGDVIGIMGVDGIIRYKTPNIERWFGWKPEDLVGTDSWETVHPEDIERIRKELFSLLETDNALTTVIYRYKRKDGTYTWIELTAVNLISNPAINGFLLNYHDITDRNRAEKQLLEAKEQADFANRSKTEFLANMSHELRTPLTIINGSSEIISTEMFGPIGQPKYLEYAKNTHEAGKHLLEVINDLLNISQIEMGSLELNEHDLDVKAVLSACHTMVKGRADDMGLGMALEIEEGLPTLRGDELRIKQVIINLVSNAIKFTPKGGDIKLAAKIDRNGRVVFSVTDTGIGIDGNKIGLELTTLGQTGNPYVRAIQGAGIGLPLSKKLMELHGGTLELESEVGVGTTATVRFPLERVVQ